MTDKPQIYAWHRKEHPEALLPLREAWTALPERDRGDLVERWRHARSLSEEASGAQLDAWGVFLDLPRGRAMDKRTDQLVSEPDEEYRVVLLERLGKPDTCPGWRMSTAEEMREDIRQELERATGREWVSGQTGRYPGARIPLSREEARRVAADPSCCSCGGGGWVAHVGTSSGEGSFPCEACIVRRMQKPKARSLTGKAQPRFDLVPPAVIDARLDLLRHSAGSVNATLRRDSNGCLRLSARITSDDAVPQAVLCPGDPTELRSFAARMAAPALETWGACLGVPRLSAEHSADYRDRLIEATEQRRWPKPELTPLQRLREAMEDE